jgi:hypothetical protein
MSVTRTMFAVSTDTGEYWRDTGPNMEGPIVQMVWVPTSGDTGGADLKIELFGSTTASGAADTGAIIDVWNEVDALATARRKWVIKQATYDTGGAITSEEFIFTAGEKMRVTVTPAGVATVGKLYVYHGL